VGLSRWWLRRFRYGPAEWLWRAWTRLTPRPDGGHDGSHSAGAP